MLCRETRHLFICNDYQTKTSSLSSLLSERYETSWAELHHRRYEQTIIKPIIQMAQSSIVEGRADTTILYSSFSDPGAGTGTANSCHYVSLPRPRLSPVEIEPNTCIIFQSIYQQMQFKYVLLFSSPDLTISITNTIILSRLITNHKFGPESSTSKATRIYEVSPQSCNSCQS